MKRPLADEYSVEVTDAREHRGWQQIVTSFADGNLYQVWQVARDGGRLSGVSRFLLKRGSDIVAAAEVRLFRLPLMARGIAYVRWGPLLRRTAEPIDREVLRQALRALRHEYVDRRGMVLRIVPRWFVEDDPSVSAVLSEEGFSQVPRRVPERSLVLDLTPDLEVIRKGLAQKWRNCLNKSEREGLIVENGSGLNLFDEFTALHDEMVARKKFAPTTSIPKHRELQDALDDELKMGIVLARRDGKACAGVVYSAIGDTALYLFGATNDLGLQVSGSYLLQWETVKLLKARQIRHYDLHGINPELNPGTYHFKKGLAGKTGREVNFVEQVQTYEASLTNYSLLLFERWRERRRAPRVSTPPSGAPPPAEKDRAL